MLDNVEKCLAFWEEQGESHGSVELAGVIEEANNVPAALAQGVVQLFFKHHPTLVSVKGPNGGIKHRSEVKAKDPSGKKTARAPKPTPAVPGVNSQGEVSVGDTDFAE
jgi:hypothetical protein